MAEIEKFNDEGMLMILKHSERQLKNDSNKDIVPKKSDLNYSITIDHGGLTDLEYYKEIVENSYLYGRGSTREKEAVTCCGWVITLPKEISDYSTVGKDEIIRLNPEEEDKFFRGAVDFVSQRYGKENMIHAKCHYDEGGQPHVHIYFSPRKILDHDQVHYSVNRKSKKAVKTETGRWEYSFPFKMKNGERIPVKNYSKLSDYYEYKLAAAEIINPIELKHFHPDLAEFFRKHNLPGAESVFSGVTGGKNISVKAMKEFTRTTGLTIDQVKELQKDKTILQERVNSLIDQVHDLSVSVKEKETLIGSLREQLHNMEVSRDRSLAQAKTVSASADASKSQIQVKDQQIKAFQQQVNDLKKKLVEMERSKDQEIELKNAEIERMQKERAVEMEHSQEWGSSSGWSHSSGWGSTERGEHEWTSEWQK